MHEPSPHLFCSGQHESPGTHEPPAPSASCGGIFPRHGYTQPPRTAEGGRVTNPSRSSGNESERITRLIDNKVTLTGAQSQGFVCHSGCNHILTLTGNDISAEWKVGYADGPVNTSYNTYRIGLRQFTMGPTDVFVPGD